MPERKDTPRTRAENDTARVRFLIPTHSLPPLSYAVPDRFFPKVGSLVVAPLLGKFRLGVVVDVGGADEHATESLVSVSEEVSLPEGVVWLCEWAAAQTAISTAAALRAALPPGIETDKYRIVRPRRGWRWSEGELVGRAELKRILGETAMRAAEAVGRVELAPRLPAPHSVEWASIRNGTDPDFGRAYRQSEMFAALREGGGYMPVPDLLSKAGASRSILRSLTERGAVRLENRPSNPIVVSSGEGNSATPRQPERGASFEISRSRGVPPETSRVPKLNASSRIPRGPGSEFGGDVSPAVSRGREFDRGASTAMGRGPSLWRMPSGDIPEAVAVMGRAVVGGGKTMLVLAPEIRHVDGLVRHLERSLPRGAAVAAYHGEIGRDRAEVWRMAGLGEIDVVVGTRAASLAPMARLGAICVADEPNEAHRAEPGYEGLPIHARELAARRGETEGVPVLLLSPTPSLRLFSSVGGSEIPPRRAEVWPSARLVDMRGSGADVSSTLVSACREAVASGGNVGVVVDRLGHATAVSCLNCGSARTCPDCGIPLSLRGKTLTCARCGHRERYEPECPECGSDRGSPTGMAVERVRERLANILEEDIGLLTAGERDFEDARVVVGTARPILARNWDVVAIPDADSFLSGGWMGSVERAFRVFHSAAESARTLLVAQTRNPEHYALQAALREDYEAFAAAELPRLRRLGYPPYSHLASLTFRGRGDAVRGAVESMLPAFGDDVEASEAVPVPGSGRPSRWRVVLRSQSREAVARAAAEAVRRLPKSRGIKLEIEIDPEEV